MNIDPLSEWVWSRIVPFWASRSRVVVEHIILFFSGKNSHLEVEGSVLGNQFSVQFDVEIPEVGVSQAIIWWRHSVLLENIYEFV